MHLIHIQALATFISSLALSLVSFGTGKEDIYSPASAPRHIARPAAFGHDFTIFLEHFPFIPALVFQPLRLPWSRPSGVFLRGHVAF